jgi:hypothetical protein
MAERRLSPHHQNNAIRRGLTQTALLERFHISKAVFNAPAHLDELRADADPSPPLQCPARDAKPA